MQVLKELKKATNNKRLICFPHSGAFSAAFRPLSQHVSPEWGIIAIDPPGHGTNRAPLVEDIQEMVDIYEAALEPYFQEPFALFGHSLGGLITYLLTQRLEKRGIRPEAVFISANKPPHLERNKVAHFNEQEFVDYVISLGGIAPELAQHQELLDLFMPVIRADFKAIENFEHTDQTLIETPVHVFVADQDHAATPEECQEWTMWAKQVEFHQFQGEHMFLMTDAPKVGQAITKVLNRRVLL